MSCEAWINPRAGAHYPSAAGRKSVSMGRASRRAPCEPGCIGGRPVTDFRSSALVSSDLSVRSSSGSSDTSVPSVGRLTFRPRHGTLSTPSSGHSTFFEIRQLDLSLAHLGHLPGARHLLDVRAGPLGPEAPTQHGGGNAAHASGKGRRFSPSSHFYGTLKWKIRLYSIQE